MLSDYIWFSTSTSKIALYDIFPYVDELAYKLSNGLVESVNSVIGPSETNFKAFVRFLLAALVDPMAFETLIPVHYHHNHPWYNSQLSYLYSLFLHLWEKMQTCLAKMGDDLNFNPKFKKDSGWDQYFSILSLLLKSTKRGDKDYKWILDRKDVTDFKSRRHLAMMLLPEVTNEYDNLHEMLINRSNLLGNHLSPSQEQRLLHCMVQCI
nr:E3 ubiquitin-protein ligase UPL5-like [Tanacetum cinerariifolium]